MGGQADSPASVRDGRAHAERARSGLRLSLVAEPAGQELPGTPATAYGARGAGGNTITIVPDRDLVVVLRWHEGNEAAFVQKVIASIR